MNAAPLAGRGSFVAIVVILASFAAFESGAGLANDDFGYLMWGLQTRDDVLAWVSGPEWFTYWRPRLVVGVAGDDALVSVAASSWAPLGGTRVRIDDGARGFEGVALAVKDRRPPVIESCATGARPPALRRPRRHCGAPAAAPGCAAVSAPNRGQADAHPPSNAWAG